ncbi:pentapeptide repeat-containing protein [Streptomyces sp. NPDC086843]|uniref:pentapeptide repeat-containing protein n=1 Tax=Streptomyces sp. NPDC086843 TaxID=3365763 RepID=UPI00380C779D
MNTAPSSVPGAPDWPYCAHGADPATDPVGCRGIQVPGNTACLAHLSNTDRDAYLADLSPGADIDHRGTSFTQDLLNALIEALKDPATGHARIGDADFKGARFIDDARFTWAEFSGEAWFSEALFSGDASFALTRFHHNAWYDKVRFIGDADFACAKFSSNTGFDGTLFSKNADFSTTKFSCASGFDEAQFDGTANFAMATFSDSIGFIRARFQGDAKFNGAKFLYQAGFSSARFTSAANFAYAEFSDAAYFDSSVFSGHADFTEVQFSGGTEFHGTQLLGDIVFQRARFAATTSFGPVVCSKAVDLSGAVFAVPVTLEIAANAVHCERTRWESTATLRLRYATVDLSNAVLSFPVAVTAHPASFTTGTATPTTTLDETLLAASEDGVRVASVRGVDATYLVLTDTDLSDCLFSGAFHLDLLRLEGRSTFAPTPKGIHRRTVWPYWWTRRRTLAEEHHWRAQTAGQPTPVPGQPPSPRHWRTGPHHPAPDLTPDPEDVAALYRQLRKAFEDGKNEPGAADFYYGEMEMRRHSRTGTPRAERGLLHCYWMLSGYGLRALRALGWLAAAMLATIVLLMGFGLPKDDPKQEATGTVPPGGGKVSFEIEKGDPQNPTGDRWTGKRFEKALNITLNSVVFRSSGQDLTTAGTYIEMTSRLVEPALLTLAVLAVRGRIKR